MTSVGRSICRLAVGLALQGLGSPALADSLLPPVRGDMTEALMRLSAACGLVLPTASLPLSRAALARGSESLEDKLVTAEDSAEATRLAQQFRDEDVPLLGISFDATYQQFLRPVDEALSVTDMVQLLERLDPLAALRLSYQINNSTELAIATEFRREYNTGTINSNFFPSVPGNPIAIENNSITEGYLRSAAGPFDVTFGRQKVHIGPSPVNSLMISQRIPFLDALNLKGNFGRLTMTLLISTLENRRAVDDVTPDGAIYDFAKTTILYNTHYFEYNFGAWRLGIGGQCLSVRPQNAFQVADFFPVMSWHQANIVPNNLSLLADFSWVPVNGLTVYGQGGFDDINLSFAGVSDGTIPTVPAFLLGATWGRRIDDLLLNAWIEGGYTHYLWGNFDDSANMARAIYRMDTDGARLSLPLTSPYGPGSIWAAASLTVGFPWSFDGKLTATYVGRNPSANLTALTYGADSSVANAGLSHWFQFVLGVRWRPATWLWISAAPEVNLRNGKVWLSIGLCGGASLRAQAVLAEGT